MTENLLLNPSAESESENWTAYSRNNGICGVDRISASRSLFYVQLADSTSQAHYFQDVAISPTSTVYALMIGYGWVEETTSTIANRPYLYGYEMSSSNRITSYLRGQSLLHSTASKTWQTLWGIFPISAGSTKIRFFLKQATHATDHPSGKRAVFDDLGLYLFNTEADAVTYLAEYQSSHDEIYEDLKFFVNGQAADFVLSAIGFNNCGYLHTEGDGLLFNHPKGIASEGNYLALADTHNNRVLLWTSLPTSNDVSPNLVLGQPDFISNDPGIGLDQMNWPVSVSIGGTKLIVADTYNDRLLYWNLSNIRENGQIADGSYTHSGVKWPWGVWTNGTKVVASSTSLGAIWLWPSFYNNPGNSYELTSNGEMGTPRTITSDGNSFLAVGDHNSTRTTTGQDNFYYTGYPLYSGGANPSADYSLVDQGSGDAAQFAWMQGDTDGTQLVMLAKNLHIWTTIPVDATNPGDMAADVLITASTFEFEGGDGSDVAISDDDGSGAKVYISLTNSNCVVGYSGGIPTMEAAPDFCLGTSGLNTTEIAENTLARFFFTNPVPASNGSVLFVASDYDRKVHYWSSLPTSYTDLYTSRDLALFQPWASVLHGSRFILGGGETLMIWEDYTTVMTDDPIDYGDGTNPPPSQIGSISFQDIRGVALDDTYFYVSDKTAQKIHIWDAPASSDSFASLGDSQWALTLDFSTSTSNPSRLSSNGTYLVVCFNEDHLVHIYQVSDLTAARGTSTTPSPVATFDTTAFGGFRQPESAIVTADGMFFLADTLNSRVFVWKNITDAIAGTSYDVLLGKENASDTTPQIGENKLFWPAAMCYDGTYLWVGEYKFSGRLMVFKNRNW